MVDFEVVTQQRDGEHYHAAELKNARIAHNGYGVLAYSYTASLTETNMIVTLPAIDALVPDGSGGVVEVNFAGDDITIPSADPFLPRTDIIVLDDEGNVDVREGVPIEETGDVEEAPMPDLADDEILLVKVRVRPANTIIRASEVWGRAINVERMVQPEFSDEDPEPLGETAAPGVSEDMSRSDHVHPRDSIVVLKENDQVIANSDTLTNDTELSFPVDVDGIYLVELFINVSSNATADFKAGIALPANAAQELTFVEGLTSSQAWGGTSGTTSTSAAVQMPSSGRRLWVASALLRIGDTGGTAQFQWAQNTSDNGDTTVHAGSLLRYRKVA